MNERIKELADEAVTRVALYSDGSMGSDKHGEWIRYDDLEKFAELLIKDIAMFSMVITDDHYDVDALYRHYGVEE